jgi:succinate dehydrogenase/fumarate reductase flavoprotein subunit
MTAIDETETKALKERALFAYKKEKGIAPADLLVKLQKTIFPWDVTIIRHGSRMKQTLEKVQEMKNENLKQVCAPDYHEVNKSIEIRNMLLCAEMVLNSAIYRTETRGGSFREDYPHMDNENWLKWVVIKPLEDGSMALGARPIPIDHYPFRPRPEKIKSPIFAIAG